MSRINIRRKAIVLLAAVGAATGLGLSSASAATYHAGQQKTGSAVSTGAHIASARAATPNVSGGGCNNLGNSLLCIHNESNGYQAELDKFQGSPVFVDFNLKCNSGRWFGDLGSFTATAPNDYTYVFAVGSQGTCHVQLLDGHTGLVIGNSPDLTR